MATGKRGRKGLGLTLNHSLSLTHNSTKILDYLYLGGQEATSERATLEFLNVTHILNVSKECGNHFPELYRYLQLPLADEPGADASRYFKAAHDFIEDARARKQCVLVHCQSGMSRSTTMVLAHVLKSSDTMTLCDALRFIKERRPRASPNAGFMAQLVALEVELRGKATIDITKYRLDRFGEVDVYCTGGGGGVVAGGGGGGVGTGAAPPAGSAEYDDEVDVDVDDTEGKK